MVVVGESLFNILIMKLLRETWRLMVVIEALKANRFNGERMRLKNNATMIEEAKLKLEEEGK